jgi:hypothetical protein
MYPGGAAPGRRGGKGLRLAAPPADRAQAAGTRVAGAASAAVPATPFARAARYAALDVASALVVPGPPTASGAGAASGAGTSGAGAAVASR